MRPFAPPKACALLIMLATLSVQTGCASLPSWKNPSANPCEEIHKDLNTSRTLNAYGGVFGTLLASSLLTWSIADKDMRRSRRVPLLSATALVALPTALFWHRYNRAGEAKALVLNTMKLQQVPPDQNTKPDSKTIKLERVYAADPDQCLDAYRYYQKGW